MKPFEKFLQHNSTLRELLDVYLELRKHLQEEGYSQEELENVTSPTFLMIRLYEKFNTIKNALFQQIIDYGFEISWNEFIEYLQHLVNKIDELIPLSNGNNKRRN
jgi:hypothetical protein